VRIVLSIWQSGCERRLATTKRIFFLDQRTAGPTGFLILSNIPIGRGDTAYQFNTPVTCDERLQTAGHNHFDQSVC
jgi:hypothetical protein